MSAQLQPVITDYLSVLDAMGAEPMSTREVAKAVGLGLEATRTKLEATRTKLHAAQADGYVELLDGRNYTWRKRS